MPTDRITSEQALSANIETGHHEVCRRAKYREVVGRYITESAADLATLRAEVERLLNDASEIMRWLNEHSLGARHRHPAASGGGAAEAV